VILAWQLFRDAPVILAANRDELIARPTDPPMLLVEDPPRWGGRDRLAGGTWLAVDPSGRVGAVTNRHPGGRPPVRDADRRSRGSLPLEALEGDDDSARDWMETLQPRDYNPVNVLYASATSAYCTSMDDVTGRRTLRLHAGVHVLTEQDIDDPADAKTESLRRRAADALRTETRPDVAIARLRELLQTHEADYEGSPACIHGDVYGTVSSATVFSAGDGVRYEHAEGQPCVTPFQRVV
jgi:uncharacterized protein with NRDE domain